MHTRRIRLVPIAGPAGDAIELIAPGAAVLGRGETCDTCLLHEGVSREHAQIAAENDGWCVRDLGSRHGTFVNGQRLGDTARVLARGDTIRIGPWTWRVEVDAAAEGDVMRLGDAHRPSRADDTYATRPTIFLRLREDDTLVRELSWQDFRDRYAPVIVGFARNAGLHRQDADDVLQDVLLSFFRISPRFEYDPARGRFRGYLKRITLNAIRQRVRRRRPASGIDDAMLDAPVAPDDADDAWENAWAARLFELAIDEVRARVDARTFEAFDLYARRGVPIEEVARRLELAPNSIHQAKSRVLRLAREIVDRLRDEEG